MKKVMGGGGWGIFERQEFFGGGGGGQLACMNFFFSFNFPLREYFFCTSPAQ